MSTACVQLVRKVRHKITHEVEVRIGGLGGAAQSLTPSQRYLVAGKFDRPNSRRWRVTYQSTCMQSLNKCSRLELPFAFPHTFDVLRGSPHLTFFVKEIVRSAWRTAEGVEDLPMTHTAGQRFLHHRSSSS